MRVWWEVRESEWFGGTVDRFDAVNGRVRVLYYDGDVRWYSESVVDEMVRSSEWEWDTDSGSAKTKKEARQARPKKTGP